MGTACLATDVTRLSVCVSRRPGHLRRSHTSACSRPRRHHRSEVKRDVWCSTLPETKTCHPPEARPKTWAPHLSVAAVFVACGATTVLALGTPTTAFAVENDPTTESATIEQSSQSKNNNLSPLACASDPTCISERNEMISAGAYAAPATENTGEEDDPDAQLRKSICPRNPTADVCRSRKDRQKINDSPCKVPLLNACLVWREGANKDVVLKR